MYLRDAAWAKRFADASRRAMATEAGTVMETILGARLCWDTAITTDHNHVSLEHHRGRELWVHRKGAMPAALGQAGVLPGSMGSSSFHVEGRGHEAALCSSAHGAGRALSRTAARAKITGREFRRQMEGGAGRLQVVRKAARRGASGCTRTSRQDLAHSGIWSR